MKEYRFNPIAHLHEINIDGEWKVLTGCTTILQVLNKPALIQWSANMAVEYVKEKWEDGLTFDELLNILEEAKSAHRKKKEKAGDWGTEMHAWVESCINSKINNTEQPGLPTDKFQEVNANNFIKWAEDNKVKFIATERKVFSEKHFLGGIVDIICEIDGEVWLADIKTSSGIYFEAFWQMAGYQIMLEEMGFDKPIKGYIVLNLKKNGGFEEKRSISNEENKEGFLSCVKIYRIQEKIKNQII